MGQGRQESSDDDKPIELTDALPQERASRGREPLTPWMARVSISLLVLPFVAVFLWTITAAQERNDFYHNLVAISIAAPLFTWAAFFSFVLGAAFGIGSLARKENKKILVSFITTINILFALSSVPYMGHPVGQLQSPDMGKKITNKNELKNFQIAIQSAGLPCDACGLALERGEGIDVSLRRVAVVWVDCGPQKYTAKTEISNPDPNAAVTLFFYGWIP